jgi:shikimate dehydrogenase
LVQRGGRVTIFNRSLEKAARLAETFGLKVGGTLEQFPGEAPFDVLVNCTSIGFKEPGKCPLEPAQLQRFVLEASGRVEPVVMDAVFLPPRTRLLAEAAAAGCRTIQGVRMLLHQACGQVELYTGLEAPLAVMEQVIEKEIGGLES